LRRALIRTSILASLFVLAAAGGYLLSARVGTEALRVEVEKQLSGIFFGDVEVGACRLVIRGGLYLEGEDVWIYRWRNDEFVGALHAPRAVAEIDPFALILGRFRLLYLMADGIEFHLERLDEGVWAPPPVQWLEDRRARTRIEGDLENSLEFWRSVENVVRTLLTKPTAARKIDVRHGRVTFRDHLQLDADGEPLELELVGVEGHLTHLWLSGNADMQVSARLTRKAEGPDAPGHPIQIRGRQRGGDMRLWLYGERLPAILLGYYVQPGGFDYQPRGAITGEGFFRTTEPGHARMTIDWQVDQFSARLPTHARPLPLASPQLRVRGDATLDPDRFSLVRMDFDAEEVGASIGGLIERPIRMTSRLAVEARLDSLGHGELRTIVKSLPGGSAKTFERVASRIGAGAIPLVVGRGDARLSRWDRLFEGRVSQLPEEFSIEARIEGFDFTNGPSTQIVGLESNVSLEGDTLSALHTRAIIDDSRLPTVDLTVRGVSHLFRTASDDRALTSEAGALPGLDVLLGLFASDTPSEPVGFPTTRLIIDDLQHPMLRWPVRNARLQIEGIENGLAIDFEEAIWAGAPVEGRVIWLGWPERSIDVDLRVIPPDPNEAPAPVSDARPVEPDITTSVEGAQAMQWASGRFEIDRIEGSFLPMVAVRGHFALQGNELLISKARADLEPRGKLIADASLSLRELEEVPVQLNFSIVSADVERFLYGIGLPEKSAEGTIHLSGALDGPMRPQTPLLALLAGEISLDARNGEIYRRLPLIVALAQASEGLRSIEERNSSIVYEFMKAELTLDRGRVSTSDFRVEGPVRLYAQGQLDPLRPQQENELVVAVFLFRQANELLEGLPVVRMFLPGSQRGLIGAYFEVTGDISDPEVRPLPARSFAEDLPDAMTAPFKVIQALLGTPSSELAPEP
jgi:hypothetical protein